jgi:flagellin-like hook-associated protein FlgL
MTISGISSKSSMAVQSLVSMRQQLDDLQQQLGTGMKSTTYAGLGLGRGITVALNGQLTAMSSYDDTITNVGTRLSVAQTSLTQFATSAQSVKNMAVNSAYAIDNTGQTTDQKTASGQLNELLDLLNTQVGDRYIFSGQSPDQPSVAPMDTILNGDATHDGLKTVIAQRNAADLGADGLGRLALTALPSTTGVKVAEDVAGSPFGFKIAGATSSIAGAVTVAAGPPASASIDFGATNPSPGDTVTLSFNLPDGTSDSLTLTATTSTTPGPNEFTIGANSTATAGSLQTALNTSIGTMAQTSLSAASAVAASNNFFNVDATHPPLRVAGPPYNNSTSLVSGAGNTVMWYTGEAGSTSARSTATARVDTSINVSYGMRANEQALTTAVSNVAVFAAMTFSPTDANASARYSALMQRIGNNLDSPPGTQKVSDIEAELAGAQTTLTDATDRHQQTSNTLTDMLQQVETVSPDQVGAEILALQTRMQAAMQTTAMLFQTSLVNYMPTG